MKRNNPSTQKREITTTPEIIIDIFQNLGTAKISIQLVSVVHFDVNVNDKILHGLVIIRDIKTLTIGQVKTSIIIKILLMEGEMKFHTPKKVGYRSDDILS